MSQFQLEVCVDSAESAIAAEKGGADRFELCTNLIIGGTTPTESLFREVRKYTNTKIHVLIRPRFGDFCYSEHEFSMMKEDVKLFRKLGAQGIVIGALKEDGRLHVEQLKELITRSEGMSVTIHRAFDMCREPFEALETCISLKAHRILTSGQRDNCLEGGVLLRELQEAGRGRIGILPGGGVTEENIKEIYEITGATEFHLSGKVTIDSAMQYRNPAVHMGLPGISEYEIYRTQEEKVRKVKNILREMEKLT